MTSQQFFYGTVIVDAPAFPLEVIADSQPAANPVDSIRLVGDQSANLQIELRVNHSKIFADEHRVAMQLRAAVLQMWTSFFASVSQGCLEDAQQRLQSIRNLVEEPVRDWTEGVDLFATEGDYEAPRLMPKTKGRKCFSWTHQATDTVTTIALAQKALITGDQHRIDEAVVELEIAVLGLLTRILRECRPGTRRFEPDAM